MVPVSGAIAIAEVEGEKSFSMDSVKYGNNRIKVSYQCDNSGNIFIPRKQLTTRLQSRLRIRMSIADLNDFSEEILKHVKALKKGKMYTLKNEFQEKEDKNKKIFTTELRERIQKGEGISLKAGGHGLEELVKELLELQGYKADIKATNQSSGIADIDIKATRENYVTGEVEILLVQVKHHKAITNEKGLKQLVAHDDEQTYTRKVLITSAELSQKVEEQANTADIITIDGERLVNWIYDSIEQLSPSTRLALGISSIPTFT